MVPCPRARSATDRPHQALRRPRGACPGPCSASATRAGVGSAPFSASHCRTPSSMRAPTAITAAHRHHRPHPYSQARRPSTRHSPQRTRSTRRTRTRQPRPHADHRTPASRPRPSPRCRPPRLHTPPSRPTPLSRHQRHPLPKGRAEAGERPPGRTARRQSAAIGRQQRTLRRQFTDKRKPEKPCDLLADRRRPAAPREGPDDHAQVAQHHPARRRPPVSPPRRPAAPVAPRAAPGPAGPAPRPPLRRPGAADPPPPLRPAAVQRPAPPVRLRVGPPP